MPSRGAMVFGEDVGRHKPAPDPYLLAASRLGSARPLVVEDSAAGVASAEEVARVVRARLEGRA